MADLTRLASRKSPIDGGGPVENQAPAAAAAAPVAAGAGRAVAVITVRGLERLVKLALRGRLTGVVVAVVAVCAYMIATQPAFLTWANWQNIITTNAVTAIISVGMTFVVLTGMFDISISSMTATAAVLVGLTLEHGHSLPLAILVGILGGTALGFMNAFVIAVLRIPFFVVTLGALSIYQSLALLLSKNGETIPLASVPAFRPLGEFANGSVGPIPTIFFVIVALYLIAGVVLRYASFGRSVFAVGSNAQAARLSGMNVTMVVVAVFAIAGVAVGIGAVAQVGNLTGATPLADPNLMLTVIAAVLLGGNSFHGGEGGVVGTAIGVLFFSVVQDALTLSNVSSFWQGLVTGVILIGSIGISVMREYRWRALRQPLLTAILTLTGRGIRKARNPEQGLTISGKSEGPGGRESSSLDDAEVARRSNGRIDDPSDSKTEPSSGGMVNQ